MDHSLPPHDSLSQPFVMADSLQYPSASHYIPPAYFNQNHTPGHMHVVAPPPRPDPAAQRKRPKYTRSKTGCLTCRAKKIKCDESKPNCLRCAHGQRECTWPEGVPARKKPAPRRESTLDTNFDARPSTAGSSGVSEASTPPTRDHTPPKREPIDLGIPPLVTRRHSEPVLHLPNMGDDPSMARRQSLMSSHSAHAYPLHTTSHTQVLPAIPEVSPSYPTHHQHHHHQSYSSASHHYAQMPSLALPRMASQYDHMHSTMRSVDASSSSGHWTGSLMHAVDPLEPFVSASSAYGEKPGGAFFA
ncbi:uncharacterized protein FIBRA_03539 [Fibroporia radiculosa]|uniref:Zn(2)-C6 fungal-type domain-containing protein n=1 Tax=Fibroporia radiculosa TaxID=599839 RepID=J4GNJ2_9APHY|nr:uncharacterized protein FIBRA_03539 [Fibroporia radiculosa]CCM01485.1 predicted protein [Fibroporia radiculosa]